MNCNRILEILNKSIIDMTRDELYEFERIVQMLNNHCPSEFGLTEQWNRSCSEDNCIKCWIESMRRGV